MLGARDADYPIAEVSSRLPGGAATYPVLFGQKIDGPCIQGIEGGARTFTRVLRWPKVFTRHAV